MSTSEILISKSALQNNISFINSTLNESVTLSSVVKGNAYGHGIPQVVPVFEDCGIRHFSVFDYFEAKIVQENLQTDSTIMIMGWLPPDKVEDAIEQGFEFFVFSTFRLSFALDAAKKSGKKAKIHLEAETGMNRTGLKPDTLEKAIEIIKQNPDCFEVKGFCTHLAGSESIANYYRIQNQINQFNSMLSFLNKQGIHPEKKHVACSATLTAYPELQFDMVRIGILQYGFWPSKENFLHHIHDKSQKKNPLRRAITWHSRIMEIKDVVMGEFIGYGNSFLAQDNMRVAVVPVGYANGFSRGFSNRGRVLINGNRCGVIGMVNMNMLTADVNNIPDPQIGDEVVLIGEQGGIEITVSSFADISDQLNYELLTRLPHNIPRYIES